LSYLISFVIKFQRNTTSLLLQNYLFVREVYVVICEQRDTTRRHSSGNVQVLLLQNTTRLTV